MRLSSLLRLRVGARHLLRQITDPYRRYQHAKMIHAIRVAVAILASIALTTGVNLPHGEWASITVLIVIGGLQHHGNIRKKAAERALGTLIGASGGLLLILVQSSFHLPALTYTLMAIGCGVGGYFAIGQAGYVALLGAITMMIVAGHGDAEFSDGLWRTANVLIGIAIALLFSFALPLYATFSWRYKLADGLRDCARLYSRIVAGESGIDDAYQKILVRQGTMLVQLRALMPSVAKEIDVSTAQLEPIQRHLRGMVGALELLTTVHVENADPALRARVAEALASEERRIRETLVGMARALKFGTLARLRPPRPARPRVGEARANEPGSSGDGVPVNGLPIELERYVWLTDQLLEQTDMLRQRLAELAGHWNI